MAVSWHSDEYSKFVEGLEDYFRTDFPWSGYLREKDVHELVGKIVNIAIDTDVIETT